LKALERVVIPRLEREVREVAAALEEEERAESVRRKRWLAARIAARGGKHARATVTTPFT
jgi:vacuolar-type H+-ATPase subunit D/Vma8